MNLFVVCLCSWFRTIIAKDHEQLLLNGFVFPSSIYIPLDRSYSFECQSKKDVYWKFYSTNGTIRIIKTKFIDLKENDRHRDGLYQCYTNDESEHVFVFSNAARSIDRQWTDLTEFHDNLMTICRPMYFIDGYNEQFIELIDSKQTVRYNHSTLLVKHIRSTTHLLCKLFIDTTTVGIRVQTLIKQNLGSPLLSDQALKTNDYLEMKSNERDLYRIAFEGDAVYFHCQSNTTQPIQWYFLSFNYYLMKTLPIIYEYDMKIKSVEISDAGMYTCQTGNTTHQRIILTVIHPPISSKNIYEQNLQVDFNSKHLLCCLLDAVPYPTYSWSMTTEIQRTAFVWCLKRCCWLHVTHRKYENIVCTSKNQLGTRKYQIHLIVHETDVNGTVVYDEPIVHHHHHASKDDFSLIRKLKEIPSVHPTVMSTDTKMHSSHAVVETPKIVEEDETRMNMSPLDDVEQEFEEQIVKEEIENELTDQ